MSISRKYKPYDPYTSYLLPLNLRDWLPENHLAQFIIDTVNELDLSEFYHPSRSTKGQPAYDPKMLVSLLLYSYAIGLPSSRKIEQKTYEDIAYRIISGNQHPDHDTISDFRKDNLKAFSNLFLKVLELAHKLNLVSLGHVALDGTKIKANASKHKAMSYDRMIKKETELKEKISFLLKEAESVDNKEDKLYGKGKNLLTLPEELKYHKERLGKIREAKAALEKEALIKNEKNEFERKNDINKIDKSNKNNESDNKNNNKDSNSNNISSINESVNNINTESILPKPTDQINFTDPESKIMLDSGNKAFIQGYNAQAAVDSFNQIILAAEVTRETNDKLQVKPMISKVKKNIKKYPDVVTADSGYYSETNVTWLEKKHIDPYIATGRMKHDDPFSIKCNDNAVLTEEKKKLNKNNKKKDKKDKKDIMTLKLRTEKGKEIYSRRKTIVEPVFGQIKGTKNYRQFLLRGINKVNSEWKLICLTHNLTKIFRRLNLNKQVDINFSYQY